MDYSILQEQIEAQTAGIQEVDPLSLYSALEAITDGRKARGLRYQVALILTLIILGKLAGAKTIGAVAHWVHLRTESLLQQVPTSRKRFPCEATYGNVLRTLDAEEVTHLLHGYFSRLESQPRCEEEPSRLCNQTGRQDKEHVALDGKTLRGTLGHESPQQAPVHLLALYEVKTGSVIAGRQVGAHHNEWSEVKTWLTPALVKGRVLTADAMFTQHVYCADVTRFGGDYLLFVKDNQPALHQGLQLYFEDGADAASWQRAEQWNKGHGRLEYRGISTSTAMNEFFEREWAGIAQVFRLQRSVWRKGQERQETIYGFTSLSAQRADAWRLLHLTRAHWTIENRLHWRRDVTLGEDHSQVRTGQAPRVLAALNCAVLALMDALGVRNVAAQMRVFDARPHEAVQLLLGSDF